MSAPRNPYVVLGVPFGTSRDVATAAFARKARRLRRQSGGAELLTDLTWALNQIEEAIDDPQTAIHLYRVPADPEALTSDSTGVLNPAPEAMGRTSPESTQALQAFRKDALAEALTHAAKEWASVAQIPSRDNTKEFPNGQR